MRQDVKKSRISIKWVPTAEMVADGLTKLLRRVKPEQFVKMLGLRDIRDLID